MNQHRQSQSIPTGPTWIHGRPARSAPGMGTDQPPRKPRLVRLFDAMAMGFYPLMARAFDYAFRVGTDPALRRDGRAILRAVWEPKGALPPPEVAQLGERYDRATTWIVAYHRGQPIGVMGLLDMRIASTALDYSARIAPPELDLDTTREIGRLAILPAHRGGAQLVLIGLLREMLAWSKGNGILRLFSGSTPRLFRVYRRFNPSAQLIKPRPAVPENAMQRRYFENLRKIGGPGILYTFEVASASPWIVISRLLLGILAGRKRS